MWEALMGSWGLSGNDEMYSSLVNAYAERHRAYHTYEHIEACLRQLDDSMSEAEHPDEVELAIWFHDVVYKPYSSNNEADSAKMASKFLRQNQVQNDKIGRVEDLILATIHSEEPQIGDLSLIVDIDLSILGAPAKVYDWFETAVRSEYKYVPSFVFKRGRKKLLEGFLSRDRIYQNESFFNRLEHQARQNLYRAIGNLS